VRLFVGIELDQDVRAAAASAAERIRARLKRARADVNVRWVDPDNLHVTLWFIGDVRDDRATEVQGVLQARFDTPAFKVRVNGCGAFPPSGPLRVFWLGLVDGLEPIRRVHAELRDRLVAIGCEEEKRPYSPHLTIARVKAIGRGSAPTVRDALAAVAADCGSCRIEAVTLFRSRLSPQGSRYEPLLRVPLS
jgi:RNA 2',3'-cyclic 3'-phosphodiesterase